MYQGKQQQTLRIHKQVSFLALDLLAGVVTMRIDRRPALFCAPDALAVDDRRRRARLAFGQFAAFHVKRMVDAIERAVVIPADEVIMYGAAWRKVLGDRAPLASGAQ